jgi:hypothetical protein
MWSPLSPVASEFRAGVWTELSGTTVRLLACLGLWLVELNCMQSCHLDTIHWPRLCRTQIGFKIFASCFVLRVIWLLTRVQYPPSFNTVLVRTSKIANSHPNMEHIKMPMICTYGCFRHESLHYFYKTSNTFLFSPSSFFVHHVVHW